MKREFSIVDIGKFFLLAVALSAGPIALVGAGYLPEWSDPTWRTWARQSQLLSLCFLKAGSRALRR